MDELILLSLQGSADAADAAELLRWRRASPENERQYQERVHLWAQTADGNDAVMPGPPPAVADVIRRAEAEERAEKDARASTRWMHRGMRTVMHASVARIAAAAALILIGYAVSELSPDTSKDLGFGADEFVTGPEETATVGLRDGTVVRLAPGSRLRLTGNLQEREVSLTGRAYFAVAKSAGRPFRINTSAGQVTVLGTRFDLSAEREDLRVVVVEGRVAVAARGQETEVTAGEVSRVLEGTLLPTMSVPDVHSLVAWKGSFLAFQATPLAEAAREIERQYDVDIEIKDPALAERTITTWLSDRDLDEVLRIVCAVAVAECSVSERAVTIVPKD